jgi:hypothetical protein
LTSEGFLLDSIVAVVFATPLLGGIPENPANLWCVVVVSPFARLHRTRVSEWTAFFAIVGDIV